VIVTGESTHGDGGHGDADVDSPSADDGRERTATTSDDASGATMLLVERETPKGLLVSVCDADVVGETFEGAGGDVTLTVDEAFYATDATRADDTTVRESLARASVANLVGEYTVSVAIEAGFVNAGNVLELEGTRHAQFLRM